MTEIRTELPVSVVAPALARDALDGWLSERVGEDGAEGIRLAASELVANALLHGALTDDDVIVLTGSAGDAIRVSIEQPTPIPHASVQPIGPAADHGMGLRIVDVVADRWGVEPGPPGIVWFEVDP